MIFSSGQCPGGNITRSLVNITTNTIAGPVTFKSSGLLGKRTLMLEVPAGTTAELIVDKRENLNLQKAGMSILPGKCTYFIKGGSKLTLTLKYS